MASVRYKRTPLTSMSGYPYREAYLFPLDFDMKKTWYIVFYAWDITTQKLVRKRVLKDELNSITDYWERKRKADEMIEEINRFLRKDYHLCSNPAPKILKYDFTGYSFIDAITYAMNYKLNIEGIKPGTAEEYIATRTTVEGFLSYSAMPAGYKLRDVNDTFITRYFDYLKEVRKLQNKTYNNRRTILHAVCEVLIRRDPKLFHGLNPFKKIAKLKSETKKHAAYSDDQVARIREEILKGNEPHLVLFIQFMIYTLARPEEIRNLKVGHIHLVERRILFASETSKTGIEQFVGIPDRLYTIIIESGILDYPENHYIFSADNPTHGPGEVMVSGTYFYKRIVRYIKRLGLRKLNKNYTLYSFKHTGAISLYKATKDIKLLQQQCRHQNIEQTNTYLRDLGLFTDFDKLNKWSGPI